MIRALADRATNLFHRYEQLTTHNNDLAKIHQLRQAVAKSVDVSSACIVAEGHFDQMGHQLVSVFFCSHDDAHPAIRPFRRLPRALMELAPKLAEIGGCPLKQEAQRLLRPFNWKSISKSDYGEFLNKRFLEEVDKLEYQSVLAVPVVLGQGIAVFSIGLHQDTSDNREQIISSVCHIVSVMVGRFPELTTLFEPKRLSIIQSKVLLLSTQGYCRADIAQFLELSETTIGLVLQSAVSSLAASNLAQAVAKALVLGEISSMQLGDHDLI